MNTQQLDQEIAVAAETRNQREERILVTLANYGERNATQLAHLLGVSPTTMRETLKRMVEAEEIVREGNLYRLPDAEPWLLDEDETVTFPLPEPDDTVILPATATTVTTAAGDRNAEAYRRDSQVVSFIAATPATLEDIATNLGVDVKTAYGSIWRLTHRENGERPLVAIVGRLGRKPLWLRMSPAQSELPEEG